MPEFLRCDKPTPVPENKQEIWNQPFDSTASAEDIVACFRLILGRVPHKEEWKGHASRAGEDLESVVSSYFKSLEFARRNLMAKDYMGSIDLVEIEGFKIFAAQEDLSVGKYIRQGQYETDVTTVFRTHLKPGMTVVDLGANIGYFTMLAAALVGEKGRVFSIEPNHRNVKLIEASRRANDFQNITIAQVAAGRELGILMLNPAHSNGTTSDLSNDTNAIFEAETVPCVPVDSLVSASCRVDFIKIDVEGAEYNALVGCERIIQRDRPLIVSEFSPDLMPGISHVDGRTYLGWLCNQGYRLGVVEPDGTVTNFEHDTEGVMAVYLGRAVDHIDLLATPIT